MDGHDRDPPTVEVRGVRVAFSRGDFAYALRGLLYGRSGEVPWWIDQVWRGRWDGLADYYIGRTDWVPSRSFPAGYHFSMLCAEDVSRVDAPAFRPPGRTGGSFGPLAGDTTRSSGSGSSR